MSGSGWARRTTELQAVPLTAFLPLALPAADASGKPGASPGVLSLWLGVEDIPQQPSRESACGLVLGQARLRGGWDGVGVGDSDPVPAQALIGFLVVSTVCPFERKQYSWVIEGKREDFRQWG